MVRKQQHDSFKQEVEKILRHSGFLVLDAHTTAADIFRTVNTCRKDFPQAKIIMPMAAYLLYLPFVGFLIRLWMKFKGISVMPVFRKHEMTDTSFPMRFFRKFYPKTLTETDKENRNEEYLKAAVVGLRTPQVIVVVSPYGGPTWFGKSVKRGVKILLQEAPYYCLSYSTFPIFVRTMFSSVLETRDETNYDEVLLTSFRELVSS